MEIEPDIEPTEALDQVTEDTNGPGPLATPLPPPRLHSTPELTAQVGECIRACRRENAAKHHQQVLELLEINRQTQERAAEDDAKVMATWPCLALPATAQPNGQAWLSPDTTIQQPNARGVPATGCPRPLPAVGLYPVERLITTHINGSAVQLQAWRVPNCPGVPPYKSWTQLKRNALSMEVGQRMFYTDDQSGETIPFEDEGPDHDTIKDAKVLDGLARESTEAAIRGVLARFGNGEAIS